jgi:hypothetical protein
VCGRKPLQRLTGTRADKGTAAMAFNRLGSHLSQLAVFLSD